MPICTGPPTSWKSLIVCPDLQLARSDLSLPKIVITVPAWTLPRGVLWIVRCVVVTVVAASATPLDRTKEKQMKNNDAMISFRLVPFIPAPTSGSRQALHHAIPRQGGRQLR